MKMNNRDKLVGIILAELILVNLAGCKKQDGEITKSVQSSISNNETLSPIEKTTNIDDILEKNIVDSTTSIESKEQPSENSSANINIDENLSKDEIIINYFNEATNDINNLLSSDNVTNVKVKCKEYFITFVDFIFYDGKIKNVTFAELKDETKKQVINIVKKVDTLIMKKFPNYKETISGTSKDLYDKASDLLHSGSEQVEDYIISKVGEDKYQEALDSIDEIKEKDKETWDNVKEFGSEVYESGKDKVKTWYEDFKNK